MSSRFRKVYRDLSTEEMELSKNIKEAAETIEIYIEKLPAGREKVLAMTKLEESVMWAIKALTG